MIHGPNSQFSGAFSFGAKQDSGVYQINDNPGPNHYSVNYTDKPIGFKFSKTNRKPLYEPSIAPDPGAYNAKFESIQASPKIVKFCKQKDHEEKGLEIGPGSYNLNDLKKPPAFTFQSRFDSVGSETLKNPGPGTYDVFHHHTQQPKNKGFTTGMRGNLQLQNNPGPGHYNTEVLKLQTNIKFPKSQRSIEASEISPGPGSFDLTMPKHQGISFGIKFISNGEKTRVPGPGSYQLKSFAEHIGKDTQLYKVRGAKIGSSERNSLNFLKQGPSPLEYDVSQYKYPSRHASFGNAIRTSLVQGEQTPGPGAYQVDTKLNKKGTVIAKAQKDLNHLESLPGPGKYNPNDSMISSKGPSYCIAGKYDKKQEPTLLGPGRYNIPRDLSDGPKYKFPTQEKSIDSKILDQNQSHCYEIKQSIGYVPTYLLHN